MDLFMCVAIDRTSFEASPARVHPCLFENSYVFQEIRIDDYIRAYTTTGRPPAALPADAAPFQPLPEPAAAPAAAPAAPTTRDPAALPAAHKFTPTKIDSDTFHTLTAMPLYRFFSLEELRAYAYLRGNKHAPTPIDLIPFVIDPAPPAPPTHTAPGAAGASGTADAQCTDQLLTISTQPQYSQHSLEVRLAPAACVTKLETNPNPQELRVAYMRAGAGRDVSSAEIFARAPALAPAPAPAPAARGPPKTPFGDAVYPFAPAYRG
ncbi:hypothetical protein C0993_010372 [Termitomyces sp. T159_Od127]|nr:hypothetical protein C0993_010372 [Termitomyces sp. T159_Od127]